MVDTGISTNTLTGVTGDITIDSPDDIVLDAAGGNIEFKDARIFNEQILLLRQKSDND